ncbi:hypothetical protein ACLOJK_034817, partial [Asimina triloba]
ARTHVVINVLDGRAEDEASPQVSTPAVGREEKLEQESFCMNRNAIVRIGSNRHG